MCQVQVKAVKKDMTTTPHAFLNYKLDTEDIKAVGNNAGKEERDWFPESPCGRATHQQTPKIEYFMSQ